MEEADLGRIINDLGTGEEGEVEGEAEDEAAGGRRDRQRHRQALQPDHHRRLQQGRLRHPRRALRQDERRRSSASASTATARSTWRSRPPTATPSCSASRSWPSSTSRRSASPRTARSASAARWARSSCASPPSRPPAATRTWSCASWPPRSRCPSTRWASSSATSREFKAILQKPYGICLVRRPHRLRQDDHPALGARLHQHRGHEDLDGRGPGRDHPAGAAAGAGPPQDRLHLRRGHALVPARRPRRDHGRRDARPRDGRDRRRGLAHRPPRLLDPAHQLGPRDDRPPPRHGHRPVQLRRRPPRHHGPAPGADTLRRLQGGVPSVPGRVRRARAGLRGRALGQGGRLLLAVAAPLPPEGLPEVRRLRLQGPHGHPRAPRRHRTRSSA